MNEHVITLPDFIEFNDYGNYDKYEQALLEVYENDLWNSGLTFNGLNVVPRVHKRFQLKDKTLDWTFAHFTSKGPVEDDRDLDLSRCKRIGWVKPIIENSHLNCVKIWEDLRHDKNGKPIHSVVLWCEQANSKIVLTKNKGKQSEYYVITTFYLINGTKKIQKHQDLYDEYIKVNGKFNVTPP